MASTAIRSAVATGDAGGPATRTRLVNIDNGGTLTDICVIDPATQDKIASKPGRRP